MLRGNVFPLIEADTVNPEVLPAKIDIPGSIARSSVARPVNIIIDMQGAVIAHSTRGYHNDPSQRSRSENSIVFNFEIGIPLIPFRFIGNKDGGVAELSDVV